MPQLDPYIFLSQFSWFLFFFFLIYYGGIIPKLLSSCEWLLTSYKVLKIGKKEEGKAPFSLKREKIVLYGSNFGLEEVSDVKYKFKR